MNPWHLIESTCRAIAGRNWQRCAAAALGVPKDRLRETFDRDDLDAYTINGTLAKMRHAAVRYEKMARARYSRVRDAAWAVQVAQSDRLLELLRGDGNLIAFENAYYADLLAETD